MKDLYDFRTHDLQADLCNKWRYARYNPGNWTHLAHTIGTISWLMQHPYSTWMGDAKVRRLTIQNMITLQRLAEERARMERMECLPHDYTEQPGL